MPFNLALADLITPYLLKGENLGAQHAALSALRVTRFETASDLFGVTIRGSCEFNGRASIDPIAGGISMNAVVDEAAPPFDPSRRSPIFDLRETTVDFELLVARAGSAIIAAGVTTIGAAAFTPTRDVLNVWDTLPVDPAPSDYPASGFQLDLILNAPSVRPPFLHPAKMTDEGVLMPDDSFQEVSIRLPKLRFRLAHGNDAGSQLAFQLVSAGTAGLDDPGDIGTAELISMEPPYAFIGGEKDRSVGFGFRSATLDLSDGYTPPAVTEKFGFGDDWAGLYLPEVRFFVAPEGAKDFAFEAGVRDLLIGFGEHAGVSGDFEVALINQGSGAVKLSARFFDEAGKPYGIKEVDETHATANLPAHTRMVVDIVGGRAPYTCTVKVGNGAAQAGRLFNIDLSGAAGRTIQIEVTDTSATPIAASLQVVATRQVAQQLLATPGAQAAPAQAATLTTSPGANPVLVIASQNGQEVLVATNPTDPSLRWSIDGGAEVGPRLSIAVPLASGETKTVRARRPGTSVPAALDYYFFFDEPPAGDPANETEVLRLYTFTEGNISTVRATSQARDRETGGQNPFVAYREFLQLAPSSSALTVRGEASYEGIDSKRDYNYYLARRRAIAIAERLKSEHPDKHFVVSVDPEPASVAGYGAAPLAAWTANWKTHGDPNRRDWWKATVVLPPGLNQPEHQAQGTLNRPAAPVPPPEIKVVDPPAPSPPRAPDWFRSVKLKVRIIRDDLVAAEIESEIDFQTAAEDTLSHSGAPAAGTPDVRTLENGAPLAPDNPADGITKIRVLVQKDSATGRITTLMAIGADPADKDGLLAAGWLPGETMPAQKDFPLTLLGAYISFWPLLVSVADGNDGTTEDAVLAGAALALPATIALLDWFRVERVILFGGEYLQRDRGGEFEGFLLFDVEVDWSVDISIGSTVIIEIEREHPLAIRYKAIGIRFGNTAEDGSPQFSLRPVFDASRGYTIDVAKDGSLKVAEPFDQILKVLGARISRTNPTMFEVDLGVAIDLGVVSIDRARVRVHLDPVGPPELTALAAGIDIPGAISGKGYMEIGENTIGGQIDLTITPINLRVAAALEIAQIPAEDGGPATGVYVSMNIVLPVGIPLGQSGLGILGFRGIFGMHYERNPTIGVGSGVPALEWLIAADGQPHLLENNGVKLWTPKIDHWAFGIGVLIGTMEGGFIMNLDGTLILELPGPRILIIMNARILVPPPSLDGMGVSGGILAVIEITPDHILIGILIEYDIEGLITVRIPVEAFFGFSDISNWHVYLGQRTQPVEVSVLDIVKGTGYLMFDGGGLAAYNSLPEVRGFAIGLGAGASFTWGSTAIGLYLRIGGSMDAVIGFSPFLLGGHFEISGELRLFIISIGAHASLTVIVAAVGDNDVDLYIHGEACGHIDFFFFSIEGCVDITIHSPTDKPPIPALVDKLSLKSRSPALAVGTGVDRPVDASLGEGLMGADMPAFNDPALIIVPIDSIPILSLIMPVKADGLTFLGTAAGGASGLPSSGYATRGAELYQYRLTAVSLDRISPAGPPVIGTGTPATWWIMKPPTEENVVAQLGLLTWEPTPAPKAIEKSEVLKESIIDRWGQTCDDAAPPAAVLWTFRWEMLGPSVVGWQLEGIAWPDPPGTQRSSPPDTLLQVTERWRSGDATLDGKRGIIPAIVVGALVPCEKPDRQPPAHDLPLVTVGGRGSSVFRRFASVGRVLAAEDPVFARVVRGPEAEPFRISTRLYEKAAQQQPVSDAQTDLVSMTSRIERGEDVTRQEMVQAATMIGSFAVAQPRGERCEVRLLESPIFDDGRLIVFGDPSNTAEVKQALDEAGVTHGPLDEVVVLHTGGFEETNLLLFVRADVLRLKGIVARVLDADGKEMSRVTGSLADRVPPKALPAHWTDSGGPWADDIADLLTWPSSAPAGGGWMTVLLTVHGKAESDRIEIGVIEGAGQGGESTSAAAKLLAPTYYVAAIESLRQSEIEASQWDQDSIEKDREVVTSFLGPDSTDNALLFPNSLYRVTATWDGDRQSDGQTGSDTQTFWFKTDAVAPPHLDPWVLMTIPADGETNYFGGEPPRLVFNTHDIDRLYAAYGKELRIRYQAASAHHPASQPTVPHPFPINPVTLTPAKAGVLSPYEETLVEVIGESCPCIPVDEDRSRQSTVIIPIPLDPYTDYILDVEMVDAGAPEDEAGERVYRRHLSTGAYGTFAAFAASLQAVLVSHRYVAAGAMESIRGFFAGRMPQGAELDEQLRLHDIEALPAPDAPRVVVLWEQTGTNAPQPAAVLVDASEPLWRTRPYPVQITDDSGPIPSQRWKLEEREWLDLELGSGSDPILAANGLIRAPGSQRGLIVLAAGSRGKRLKLDLREPAFTEPYLDLPETRINVVDIEFDRAPWEE